MPCRIEHILLLASTMFLSHNVTKVFASCFQISRRGGILRKTLGFCKKNPQVCTYCQKFKVSVSSNSYTKLRIGAQTKSLSYVLFFCFFLHSQSSFHPVWGTATGARVVAVEGGVCRWVGWAFFPRVEANRQQPQRLPRPRLTAAPQRVSTPLRV